MPRRTSAPGADIEGGLLTIGALSTATGIPVDTIRTWERRYGYPLPERKPSGHRVYALSTVPRLRRVAQAIARGHRAAEVLPATESALEVLLASLPPAITEPAGPRADAASGMLMPADAREVLQWVRGFDAERLKRWFQTDWARLGPLQFLEYRAAAFLRAVGDAWAAKELEVRHEHFASAVLGDFLRSVRQPLEDRARGPIAALATLPGRAARARTGDGRTGVRPCRLAAADTRRRHADRPDSCADRGSSNCRGGAELRGAPGLQAHCSSSGTPAQASPPPATRRRRFWRTRRSRHGEPT